MEEIFSRETIMGCFRQRRKGGDDEESISAFIGNGDEDDWSLCEDEFEMTRRWYRRLGIVSRRRSTEVGQDGWRIKRWTQ